MSTFKVLPDFETAMAAIRDYAVSAGSRRGGYRRADFEAAAAKAGWTREQKTEFLFALLDALRDLPEKPN